MTGATKLDAPGYAGAGGNGYSPGMGAMQPPQMQAMTQKSRPSLASGLTATCPLVVAIADDKLVPLRVASLNFKVEVHISTAFVKVETIVAFPDSLRRPTKLMLFVPKSSTTTISDLLIENLVRNQLFATTVVPVEEVRKNGWTMSRPAGPEHLLSYIDGNDPELFSLPLPQAQPGDQYRVSFMYFEPLLFQDGSYYLTLPTTLQNGCITQTQSFSSVLSVQVMVNTGIPEVPDITVLSHPTILKHSEMSRAELTTQREMAFSNLDFVMSYKVWGPAIVASLNVQPAPPAGSTGGDPRGTFALAVSPPAPEHTQAFSRSVVLIVDRSGSMAGAPMDYATQAIQTGLGQLTPADQFTIVAFDHEQIWFHNELVDATPPNIDMARHWCSHNLVARGLTDILTPLQAAMEVLRNARGLPYVFLLTDGAVDNERQICRYVESLESAAAQAGVQRAMVPRVATFAIGPYCNHFFLKLLATIGRGTADVAFRPNTIRTQMERMLLAASKPVLTNITLTIEGVGNVELYPYPVPDLFVGQPLLVCGRFAGNFPPSITLNGMLPNGAQWSQAVFTGQGAGMPLDRIFVKNQLDLMIARAWLQEQPPEMVQQIVDLSMATGVPCTHTRTVGFETNRDRFARWKKLLARRPNGNSRWKTRQVARFALGGVAGVAVVAGVTAAFVFGDLASTIANNSVIGAIAGDPLSALGGAGGCCDFGGCDGCDGCGDCCGDCGDCFEGIGEACCCLIQAIGDI